jgi:hypothetical protein
MHAESTSHGRGAGKHHFHRVGQPRGKSLWAGHGQRCGSSPELAVQYELGYPTEVVDVHMRHEHGGDRVGIDPLPRQRNEAGRAAVEQDTCVGIGRQMDTGLQPAAAADRVAWSSECDCDTGGVTFTHLNAHLPTVACLEPVLRGHHRLYITRCGTVSPNAVLRFVHIIPSVAVVHRHRIGSDAAVHNRWRFPREQRIAV